jgi:major membrane immunogen (membrane-anchored lipoprotein)
MKTKLSFALASLVLLGACGEKPQTLGGVKSDAAPYTGVGESQYVAPGWKAGDKTAWEQQLRARSQGQNDYSRAN